MEKELSRLSHADLRSILKNSRHVLRTLANGVSAQPDMQELLRLLSGPGDVLAHITELAAKDPELIRLVLRASMMSLTNVQGMEKASGELRRRAATEN